MERPADSRADVVRAEAEELRSNVEAPLVLGHRSPSIPSPAPNNREGLVVRLTGDEH
jgi:hypothetical protein